MSYLNVIIPSSYINSFYYNADGIIIIFSTIFLVICQNHHVTINIMTMVKNLTYGKMDILRPVLGDRHAITIIFNQFYILLKSS